MQIRQAAQPKTEAIIPCPVHPSITVCVVFVIIIIIVSSFVIIRIIAVVVRIQPFVLKGTCLSHFDIIFS